MSDILPSNHPQDNLCRKCGKYPYLNNNSALWCRSCRNEYARDNARKHHTLERGRRRFLLRNYGITKEEYDRMLLKQRGVCACCGESETAISDKTKQPFALAVDHCHETGKVRALLCRACNQLVGRVEHDERVKQAMDYLKKHKKRSSR